MKLKTKKLKKILKRRLKLFLPSKSHKSKKKNSTKKSGLTNKTNASSTRNEKVRDFLFDYLFLPVCYVLSIAFILGVIGVMIGCVRGCERFSEWVNPYIQHYPNYFRLGVLIAGIVIGGLIIWGAMNEEPPEDDPYFIDEYGVDYTERMRNNAMGEVAAIVIGILIILAAILVAIFAF